jgi:hypothetical protein
MKLITGLIAALALGITAASGANAQGRHDEKPHGMQKPPVQSAEPIPPGGPMGRHDERPHGPRKPAAKKADGAPSAEGAKK